MMITGTAVTVSTTDTRALWRPLHMLKGSYEVAKKNIILCICCNAMFLLNLNYFSHTVHYCFSSMLCLSETRRFLQSSSFWERRRALIGLISSALWLAEYQHVMEMLRPLPYLETHSVSTIDTYRYPIRPLQIRWRICHLGTVNLTSFTIIINEYSKIYKRITCSCRCTQSTCSKVRRPFQKWRMAYISWPIETVAMVYALHDMWW